MSNFLLLVSYIIIVIVTATNLFTSILVFFKKRKFFTRESGNPFNILPIGSLFITVFSWLIWATSVVIPIFLSTQLPYGIIVFFAGLTFVAGTIAMLGLITFTILTIKSLLQQRSFSSQVILILWLMISLVLGLMLILLSKGLVVGVDIRSIRLVYSTEYDIWRRLYSVITIGTILILLYIWVRFYNQNKETYSLYVLSILVKGFLFLVIWSSLWNVLVPNWINTSKFSIMGPLGASVLLYIVLAIWSFNYLGLVIKVIKYMQTLVVRIFIYSFYFILLYSLLGQIGAIRFLPVLFFLGFILTESFISYVINTQYAENKLINFVTLAPLLSHIGRVSPVKLLKKSLLSLKSDRKFIKNVYFAQQPGSKFISLTKNYNLEEQFSNINWNVIKNTNQNISWAIIDDVVWYRLHITSMHNEKVSYDLFIQPAYGKYIPVYLFLSTYNLSLSTILYLYEVSSLYATFNQRLEKQVKIRTAELEQANRRILAYYNKLNSLYKALKTSDEAKTMFISIVSHQLRTPLSVIRNYIDMLESQMYGNLNAKQLDILQRIKDSATRLGNLVVDVLQSSRLERGKFSFILTNAVIDKLVKEVVEQYEDIAKRKDIKFTLHVAPKVRNIQIRCDKDKIFEAFSNIIDNALHYTPRGGKVDVFLYKPNDEWIIFAVKDTGIGIPDNEKHKLFTKFTRLDNAKKVRPDGTGIGLYLVKKIIDGHNGKIWFKSKIGKGTTFYIALRLDPNKVEQYVKAHNINQKVLHSNAANFTFNQELKPPNTNV